MSKKNLTKSKTFNINSISNQLENESKMESFIMKEVDSKSGQEKKVSFSKFKQIRSNSFSVFNYPLEDQYVVIGEGEWSQMDENEKITYVVFSLFKFLLILLLVYAFMVSLGLLSTGIILVSNLERKSYYFNSLNSFSVVIILTALFQNPTVVLSILVTMTSSGILEIRHFASSCMACYLGALVKNILLASSFQNSYEFKRLFRAAALNQGFHLITTLILLPLEIVFGFMFRISEFFIGNTKVFQMSFLNEVISQFVESFVILKANVAQRCCDIQFETISKTNSSDHYLELKNTLECPKFCNYFCLPLIEHFGDAKTGILLSILASVLLFLCLFAILKVFSSLIAGPLAKWVIYQLSDSVPKKFKWIFNFILIFCSMFFTALLQNSNSFTSTLVNLYQLKVVSLQRTYLMTIGSNLGMIIPIYLLAFIQPSPYRYKALQLAIINNLYLLLGSIFWLPFTKIRLPIFYANFLAGLFSKHKWTLRVYCLILFCIGPLLIFGLALIKPYWIGFLTALIIVLLFFLTFTAIKTKDRFYLGSFFDKIYYRFNNNSVERKQLEISLDSFSIEEAHKIDRSCYILILLRKLSIMNGLVNEGKQFSQRNSTENNILDEKSEDESFCNEFESHETNHGMYIFSNSSFQNIRDVTSTPN